MTITVTEYHSINDNGNCGPDNKFNYEINLNDVDVMLLFLLWLEIGGYDRNYKYEKNIPLSWWGLL